MANELAIQLFENKRVRVVWNDEEEKYYFSVVDIVQVLTDSKDYQTAPPAQFILLPLRTNCQYTSRMKRRTLMT